MTRGNEAGFTLLEVLVTVAVLSLSFGMLFPIFSDGAARSVQTHARMQAHEVATSVINEIVLSQSWEIVPAEGEDENWTWEINTQRDDTLQNASGYVVNLEVSVQKNHASATTLATVFRSVWVDQ